VALDWEQTVRTIDEKRRMRLRVLLELLLLSVNVVIAVVALLLTHLRSGCSLPPPG